MNETKTLSRFVADLSYDAIPSDVVTAVKKCLLDYAGVATFATVTEAGKILSRFCTRNNFGRSTIFPQCTASYDPAMAALANGTLAHGFELDDIHTPSASHPGSVIIPASIALGEKIGVDGKRLIEAIVAGYEVMARVGMPIAMNMMQKGHHATGTFGTFGATAACAKILGLTADQIESALGIAGSFASGINQFAVKDSMVKRIHAGKAAQQGVMIALLAQEGFRGPAEILEGKYGFWRVFTDKDYEPDCELAIQNLGKEYAVNHITVKPSAACGVIHPVIDCLETIKRDSKFVPDIDSVEKIVVKGHKNLVEEHNTYEPESILIAQYSLPFSVGLYFCGNINNPKNYLDDSILRNPSILAWGKRVSTQFDEEVEAACPALFGAKVEIIMKNGQRFSSYSRCAKGGTENPYTLDDVLRKYQTLVSDVLTPALAAHISDGIQEVETLENVQSLFGIVIENKEKKV